MFEDVEERQDWLHDWLGPVKNENVGLLVQKQLKIKKQQRKTLNQTQGPSKYKALCNYTGHTPMKPALERSKLEGGDK